ncbi:MAG: sugar transferase [Saprospiraceae bacterium]
MKSDRYLSAPSLDTRELLFIGFDPCFDVNIREFPYRDHTYHYDIVNTAEDALNWLEARVFDLSTYHLPYAVFCRHQWLEENRLELAAYLRAHADLRYVPLLVFAGEGEDIDAAVLLQHGVDDCYTMPVLWNRLEARLDFLNQYKPTLLELAGKLEREDFRYRIPFMKRVFDIAGALTGILLSSFIWLPVAIAIAMESKGPVFYQSKRVGADYRVFEFLKFRSMYQDADRYLAELQHLNVYGMAGDSAVFVKFAHDPRITRVGRFIRKYSIDELPQLINVLRGEMSLVGNRPLPVYEAEMLTRDEWSTRFLAPAGITGLWQVSKRDQPDMSAEERIDLDIEYARNYSIWTDLIIILRTFRAVVQQGEC